MNKSEPFSVLVIEEIALEGLDGINFEGNNIATLFS